LFPNALSAGTYRQEDVTAKLLASAEYYYLRASHDDSVFLKLLYLDALGRPIDTASYNYYYGSLINHNITRETIASNLLYSDEAHGNVIWAQYLRLLHRAPDAAATAYWVPALRSGGSLRVEDLQATLIGSSEYAGNVLGGSGTGTETIVDPGPNAPVATDDSYALQTNQSLTDSTPGVLGNDTDVDYDPLKAFFVTGPSHGSLTQFNQDGSFTYVPAHNYLGTDSFTYEAYNGAQYSNIATVTVTISDDPPTATADQYVALANHATSDPAKNVLLNDSDPDNEALAAALVSGPSHAASFVLNADGTFAYTPVSSYTGADSFTYQASDGILSSPAVAVSLTVSGSPIADDDFYGVFSSGSITVSAVQGVISNDFDPITMTLIAQLTDGPRAPDDPPGTIRGTLTFNPDGSFIYTGAPGLGGKSILFWYRLQSGGLLSAPALVTLVPVPAAILSPLQLETVKFTNGILVDADPGEQRYFGTPATPLLQNPLNLHWKDVNHDGLINPAIGEFSYPVAYVQKSTVKVAATFRAGTGVPYPANLVVHVSGELFDHRPAFQPTDLGIALPDTVATFNRNSGLYEVNITANKALPAGMWVYHPLEIVWQYNFNGVVGTTQPAGTSGNEFYVLFAPPAPETAHRRYHSLFYQAFSGAGGQTAVADAINAIWESFQFQNDTNYKGEALGYYKNWSTQNLTRTTLLSGKDGQCGAWADFFLGALQVQGLTRGLHMMRIEPSSNGGLIRDQTLWLLVNIWAFPDNGTPPFNNAPDPTAPNGSGQAQWPAYGPVADAPNGWAYKGTSATVNDRPGIPGQNSADPQSMFPNHVIIKVSFSDEQNRPFTLWYDPSYGVTYDSLLDMDNNSIAGFYRFQGSGNSRVFKMTPNDRTKLELVATRIGPGLPVGV
jgi:hypothetical protein